MCLRVYITHSNSKLHFAATYEFFFCVTIYRNILHSHYCLRLIYHLQLFNLPYCFQNALRDAARRCKYKWTHLSNCRLNTVRQRTDAPKTVCQETYVQNFTWIYKHTQIWIMRELYKAMQFSCILLLNQTLRLHWVSLLTYAIISKEPDKQCRALNCYA